MKILLIVIFGVVIVVMVITAIFGFDKVNRWITKASRYQKRLVEKHQLEEHILTLQRITRERAEKERIQQLNAECDKTLKDFLASNPYVALSDWEHIKEEIHSIYDVYHIDDQLMQERNTNFKIEQKQIQKEYFDTLLNYPLDEQQRDAIVNLGENVLVTAAAGSGKTSTIVAKTHYLVEKMHVDPRTILVVTYTRKAAEELAIRVGVSGVECSTFHKHAIDTISLITGEKPMVCEQDTLSKVFYSMIKKDEDFGTTVLQYETILKSLLQYDYEYDSYAEFVNALKECGNMSPYRDMDSNICYMKSRQEMELMVILTDLGLNVKYEENYPIKTTTKNRRQYKPDFTIHYQQVDGEGKWQKKAIYLEHFGIDDNGQVPAWFGDGKRGGWAKANKDYNEGIVWKKETHQANGTTLIYTTSGDFQHGLAYVREKIKNQLEALNVPLAPLDYDEKMKRLALPLNRTQDNMLKLVGGFITLMKANGKDIQQLIKEIPETDTYRDRNIFILKSLVEPLYTNYQSYLQKKGECDFTDCLLKASALLEERLCYNYRYILVDEFQDMSMDKYRYLKALRKDYPRTRIFCVGDDWQSIYRFSGSDICLFSQFEKFNGYTEESKIEATHRFGEPLLKRSSDFVLANPAQKKKQLRADKDRITHLAFAGFTEDMEERMIIEKQIAKLPEGTSVYLLSRYKFDIGLVFPEVADQVQQENNSSVDLHIGGRKVSALTIHSAKGLEADYVFVLNCSSGFNGFGFPSQVSDDPIMEYVLSDTDGYQHAEERRLFYVAITRAKRATYVLYNKQYPSLFVTEMGGCEQSKFKEQIRPCPRCGNGQIKIVKDGYASNGTFYTIIRCTNNLCDIQNEMVFFNAKQGCIFFTLPFEKFLKEYGVSNEEKAHISIGHRPAYIDALLVIPCSKVKQGELHLVLDPKYDEYDLAKFYQKHLPLGDMIVTIYRGNNMERMLLSLDKNNSNFVNEIDNTTNAHP